MQGGVLDCNAHPSDGCIAVDDGLSYRFTGRDIKSQVTSVLAGTSVDFVAVEDAATDIFLVKKTQEMFSSPVGSKSKIAAALLAFFLRRLGLHKFYLGYNKAGIIMLLCVFPGFMLFGTSTGIICVVAFVECILYLTKSDEDFYQTYEVGERQWF